jgi:uncharacterized protein YukE
MKSISKNDRATVAKAADTIRDALAELEVERENFAATAQRLVEKITEAQGDAFGVLDDAAREAEDYFDQRSEKWQDGDTGSAYAEWRDRLRSAADAMNESLDLEIPEGWDEPSWLSEIADVDDFAEFGE